jgi:hypothetical protein
MRLFDATLDLARFAQGIETHKITSVSGDGKKFYCDSLSAKMGEYTNGGTCWFLDGECEGQFGTINRGRDQVIELVDAFDGFAAGDNVALSWFHYFDTQNLINAINHVLYDYPIMEVYEDTTEEPVTYHHNVYEYELPEDVSIDIRRVELQCKNFHFPFPQTLPDTFATCHYWQLNGRTLVIDPHWIYKWGGRIKIHYVKDHGMILNPETELISEQVDKNYLRKMANLWLWTHEIQMKHKDNPIAVDMYNQAKMEEDNLNKKNVPENNLMPKDLCYFW